MSKSVLSCALLLLAYIVVLIAALLLQPLKARGAALCGWSPQERAGAWAGATLTLLDWAQTRVIAADRPGTTTEFRTTQLGPSRIRRTEQGFAEANPWLGPHPEPHEVNLYFAGLLAVGLAGGCWLPGEWRGPWLWIWSGMELQAVVSNHWRGVRISGSF